MKIIKNDFDSRPQPRVKIVLYNPKSTSRMLYIGLSHEEASKSWISMRDEPERIVRIIQSHDTATNFFMWEIYVYPTEAPKSLILALAPCSYNISLSHEEIGGGIIMGLNYPNDSFFLSGRPASKFDFSMPPRGINLFFCITYVTSISDYKELFWLSAGASNQNVLYNLHSTPLML